MQSYASHKQYILQLPMDLSYSVKEPFHNLFWAHNKNFKISFCSYFNFKYSIKSQFCTCHDQSVVSCGSLWSDHYLNVGQLISLNYQPNGSFAVCNPVAIMINSLVMSYESLGLYLCILYVCASPCYKHICSLHCNFNHIPPFVRKRVSVSNDETHTCLVCKTTPYHARHRH